MATLGIVCPTTPSHLYSAGALGGALVERGHRVVLFGTPDGEPLARAAGVEFQPHGHAEFSPEQNAEWFARIGRLSGTRGLRELEKLLAARAAVRLSEVPAAARSVGVDALLVDQSSPEGGTVAERLDVPFVSVCSALMLNRDPDVPPFNTLWRYNASRWARIRNRIGNQVLDRITATSRQVITAQRRQWGLPPRAGPNDLYSNLAQLCQQPAEFEFPRRQLPRCLHFTGPFETAAVRAPVAFPYHRLSGQPLVYASMGTLFNRSPDVFLCIAEACRGLDVQLVLSAGGAPIPAGLDASVVAVRYAPQLELLSRAAAAVTHAGLSTVLQGLARGVPMVALPVIAEQPGVAARLVWSGAGECLAPSRLRASGLQAALQRVLQRPAYRAHAERLRSAIQRAGGVTRAADVVEQVLATGAPVWAR